MTLEEYLRKNSGKTPDHMIRCRVTPEQVSFYIHPHSQDGDTADFVVKGNQLAPDPSVHAQAKDKHLA